MSKSLQVSSVSALKALSKLRAKKLSIPLAEAQLQIALEAGYRDFTEALIKLSPKTSAITKNQDLTSTSNGILNAIERISKSPSGPFNQLGWEKIYLGTRNDGTWMGTDLVTSHNFIHIGDSGSGKTESIISQCMIFHCLHQDTSWYFIDGKGTGDYLDIATLISEYQAASLRVDDDGRGSLANVKTIFDAVLGEYQKRQDLFKKAYSEGKHCANIYEYRKKVGAMPQVFVVIDEFTAILSEMNWSGTVEEKGSLAYFIKLLFNEGDSYGIHFILGTQRYQSTDVPMQIRDSLKCRFVHSIRAEESTFLELDNMKANLAEYIIVLLDSDEKQQKKNSFLLTKPWYELDHETPEGTEKMRAIIGEATEARRWKVQKHFG